MIDGHRVPLERLDSFFFFGTRFDTAASVPTYRTVTAQFSIGESFIGESSIGESFSTIGTVFVTSLSLSILKDAIAETPYGFCGLVRAWRKLNRRKTTPSGFDGRSKKSRNDPFHQPRELLWFGLDRA